MKKKSKRYILTLITALFLIGLFPIAASAASRAAPGKVTLSKISATKYNKITVSWKKATNATSYVVYYKKAGTSKWTRLKTLASSKTSYTHTSSKKYPIVPGQKYTYTVRAYSNKAKKYGSYNAKGLTTSTKPSAVSLQSATLNSAKTAVTVSWKRSYGNDYYRVYRKTTSSPKWVRIASVKSSVLSYTDKKPVKGEVNTYTVRALRKSTGSLSNYNSRGISVTVPKPTVKVTSVTLKKTSCTLTSKGQTLQLTAIVAPTNATNRSLSWVSSNTAVATVSSTGKITAVANGTATITATSKDGSNKKATCKVTVNIPVPTPTATPKPTATPTPVKVTSVSLNKTSVTLTSKGQTFQLTATVAPSNATNKRVDYSVLSYGVVTVSDEDGLITAYANGTTTVRAYATDGSGKYADCTVTVAIPTPTATPKPTATPTPSPKPTSTPIPTPTATPKPTATPTPTPTTPPSTDALVSNISVAGGKGKLASIYSDDTIAQGVDLCQVKFEVSNTDCLEITGIVLDSSMSYLGFKGTKVGSTKITVSYNGKILKIWNVTITSDWSDYLAYENWKKGVEAQIWNSSMSVTQKLDALKNYIQTNFKYSTESYGYMYAYTTMKADCVTATGLFGDMAKDLGLKVGYVDYYTGTVYEYLTDAVSYSKSHINNAVWLDGKWVGYDAQPPVNG